jgi:hypothetical protein
MALTVPNASELVFLSNIIGANITAVGTNPPTSLYIHLYQNTAYGASINPDPTTFPTCTTTTGCNNGNGIQGYEVTAAGYSPVALTSASSWTISNNGTTGVATAAAATFTITAATNVDGYYVTNSGSTGGQLYWLEPFTTTGGAYTSFQISSGGGSITITLNLSLKNTN